MGEIWQISKRTERETKQIARSVCAAVKSTETDNFDNVFGFQDIDTTSFVPSIQSLDVGWQDAGQLEDFTVWGINA